MGIRNCTLHNSVVNFHITKGSTIENSPNAPTKPTPPPPLYELAIKRRWDTVITRSRSNPKEASWSDHEGGTALHAACYLLAPETVVQSLLAASPSAASCRTRQLATPLHIACVRGASVDVVRTLIEACPPAAVMIDRGGGTPLHVACSRYGYGSAPAPVLRCILQAYPHAVVRKDDAGRTPLSIMTDEFAGRMSRAVEALDYVANPFDLPALRDSGCVEKMTLLIRAAYQVSKSYETKEVVEEEPFRIVHACSGVRNCPVSFLKLAMKMYPEQLRERDWEGNLPLHIAASTRADDQDVSQSEIQGSRSNEQTSKSVIIDTILAAYPDAIKIAGKDNNLPLHAAIQSRQGWDIGIKSLLEEYPEALQTGKQIHLYLYPNILSLVGRDEDEDDESGGRCQLTTMFRIIASKPDMLRDSSMSSHVDSTDNVSTGVKYTGIRRMKWHRSQK